MENGQRETLPATENNNNWARLAIMELTNIISVPMSLIAVIRLNIADAIWQNGSNKPLSAGEILSRILPAGTGAPANLQRVLRLLTSYGVFDEHLNSGDDSQRRYSLTEVGKTLVSDEEGLSYGAYVLQHHQEELVKAWPVMHEALVDPSVEPFMKANGGEKAYEMYGKRPEMNDLMQRAMAGASVPFMKAVLDGYDGFKGVKRLVDVGGSAGDCLRMILGKHSDITEGINFDLPEVVAKAPEIAGVTHVAGDIFEFIPKGDAILMKSVLTTFTDDQAKKIMRNCFKAISTGGKLIVCEPVLPRDTDDSQRTRALLGGDVFVMTMYCTKGKHRTEEEFIQLGKSVGFTSSRAIYLDYFYTLFEFKK